MTISDISLQRASFETLKFGRIDLQQIRGRATSFSAIPYKHHRISRQRIHNPTDILSLVTARSDRAEQPAVVLRHLSKE